MRFVDQIYKKHDSGDPFLVMSVCSSYRPRKEARNYNFSEKTPVVNLRTGEVAYFLNSRKVISLREATLVLEDN